MQLKIIKRLKELEAKVSVVENKPSQMVINKHLNNIKRSYLKNGALIIEMASGEKMAVAGWDLKALKGESIKGESIKGDKGLSAHQLWLQAGNKGDAAVFLESLRGGVGDSIRGGDGLSAYQIWAAAGNKGTERVFLNSLKGKDAEPTEAINGVDGCGIVDIEVTRMGDIVVEYSDGRKVKSGRIHISMGGGATVPEARLLPTDGVKGDILAHNGTDWVKVPIGSNKQYYTPNDAASVGASWQDKGFSYLTDELGNALTDELGNALEGKDAVDARLLVNNDLVVLELTSDSDISLDTDVVFSTGSLTSNLYDPSLKSAKVILRCISGTMTITSDEGTVETTSLTVGQATTLVSRATGWFEV